MTESGPEPKLRRRVKDPWWNGITTETRIALYEGAKDAHLLHEAIEMLAEEGGQE